MLDVLKTVNKILRIVFVGAVVITAIVKAFDVKTKDKAVVNDVDEDYITSEFDEIW